MDRPSAVNKKSSKKFYGNQVFIFLKNFLYFMDRPSAFNKKCLYFCLKTKNSNFFLFHAAIWRCQ